MIEEFITYNGFIYKKVADVNSMIKMCPNCGTQYFTKEQRQIFCSNRCKTQNHRAKQIKTKDQAQQVLEQGNRTILMLEGGVQAKEQLLRKIESSNQPTGIVELDQQPKQKPRK